MRAVWLTDLHLDFLDVEQLKAFTTMVMRERPAVLFVTGDTGQSGDVGALFDMLGLIAPVYGVLGNHDYYHSTIADVRAAAARTRWWLPAHAPVALSPRTTLVGVDGWGDGRCGNAASKVRLADWKCIGELARARLLVCSPEERCAVLQALGDGEAAALERQLAAVSGSAAPRELVVLTHVPPLPEACWYEGACSSPDWLPWFTCVAVGEVVRRYARGHPDTAVTVLCGHTHGRGEHREGNLWIRTGGWAPGERSYGNPIVQAVLEV